MYSIGDENVLRRHNSPIFRKLSSTSQFVTACLLAIRLACEWCKLKPQVNSFHSFRKHESSCIGTFQIHSLFQMLFSSEGNLPFLERFKNAVIHRESNGFVEKESIFTIRAMECISRGYFNCSDQIQLFS